MQTRDDLLRSLTEQMRRNGGAPLREITIESHGRDATLLLASGEADVPRLARQLVERRILAPGGTLILSGCEVAKGLSGYYGLKEAAEALGITIKASDIRTVYNSDVLLRWVFPPDGHPHRESALDPRNWFRNR